LKEREGGRKEGNDDRTDRRWRNSDGERREMIVSYQI
jgi:hypothetical protein